MTSFLDPVIAFVSAHPWLAYLTLFLAALLEAIPVVGALVPGSTIILALSALVPGGELTLWGVLAAAIAGALIGDGSAFWTGHRSQREILGAWPMSRYPCRDGAERGVLPPLGHAGGVFRAVCAADQRVRAGDRRRARDAAGPVLRRQYCRGIGVGLGACAAGRVRGLGAAYYAGLPHHQHVGKHLWMLAVFAAAIIALGVWTLRRRQARPGLRPGAGPT